jgi:protein-tyrosine phosphatase
MASNSLTSVENPLRIAEIPCLAWPGLLGVTFAPGKQQRGSLSGTHQRDLAADLDRIVFWRATAVVTLVEADELRELKISTLGEEVQLRRMEWFHWPIKDYGIPDSEFEASWPTRSTKLRSILAAGGRVLIHCKGGLGRAGTISARLLVEAGVAANEAIAAVRAARPGAVETSQQEGWIALGRPVADRSLDHPFAAQWMTSDWTLRQRLSALVRFVPIFERPGFKFSDLIPPQQDGGITSVGAFVPTDEALAFNYVIYGYGWVRSFDWTTWKETERGGRLMRDVEAMATATEDDLADVITTCARADRFCDGYLNEAYNEGLLTRIVQRAEVLLTALEAAFDPNRRGKERSAETTD